MLRAANARSLASHVQAALTKTALPDPRRSDGGSRHGRVELHLGRMDTPLDFVAFRRSRLFTRGTHVVQRRQKSPPQPNGVKNALFHFFVPNGTTEFGPGPTIHGPSRYQEILSPQIRPAFYRQDHDQLLDFEAPWRLYCLPGIFLVFFGSRSPLPPAKLTSQPSFFAIDHFHYHAGQNADQPSGVKATFHGLPLSPGY